MYRAPNIARSLREREDDEAFAIDTMSSLGYKAWCWENRMQV